MKLFQLLLSLCLALLLCSVPLIQAQQTIPPIPTAAPTPPNGAPGVQTGHPPPPNAPATELTPTVSTEYPNYAG